MQYMELVLTNVIVNEIQGSGKMARVISPFLKSTSIRVITALSTPETIDSIYNVYLGAGERSVIKAALNLGLTPIIDDKDAFLVACRFGLHPMGFQDLIVHLARESNMPASIAIEIVTATFKQFPAVYLAHTLEMLK
jgi:predicted nucleic acid-binding protein